MTARKQTDYIAIHCSATKASMDIGADTIRRWHLEKGWKDIGYHFVIKRDGTVETGRKLEDVGAHVEGYNWCSIGICMVGGLDANGKAENNFTPAQFKSLEAVVKHMKQRYPKAIVQGHRDFPKVAKDCPCFNAKDWWAKVA